MLHWPNGSVFARGRSRYLDQELDRSSKTPSIYIQIEFNGRRVLAKLDTGAAWSMINAELAEDLKLFDKDGQPEVISTRLGNVKGKLVRTTTRVVADEGESVDVHSTVFVSQEWTAGTFVGYTGLLERIRFAIDPEKNMFMFGAQVDEELQ